MPSQQFAVWSFKCAKSTWIGIVGILAIVIGLLIAKPSIIPADSQLDGYIIALDPGHGGRDSGSSHAGFSEKDITLLLSQAIAQEVQARGGIAILTRITDTDLWDQVTYQEEIEYTKKEYELDKQLGRKIDPRDRGIALGTRFPPTYRLGLRARILTAQKHNAHILISIHTNHYRAESAKGAVTSIRPTPRKASSWRQRSAYLRDCFQAGLNRGSALTISSFSAAVPSLLFWSKSGLFRISVIGNSCFPKQGSKP